MSVLSSTKAASNGLFIILLGLQMRRIQVTQLSPTFKQSPRTFVLRAHPFPHQFSRNVTRRRRMQPATISVYT